MISEIENEWKQFSKLLVTDIAPIYEKLETTFDFTNIHGRMHIFRSVIFAEWMSRYYTFNQNVSLDIFVIRIATAFHDAGRRGNGPDLWESDSLNLCHDYLVNHGYDRDYAQFVSKLILKHGEYGIEKRIVHDADVLEIMRPCCGHGGLGGFTIKHFRFARQGDPYFKGSQSARTLRESLVTEAWKFILATEAKKQTFRDSANYFEDLLNLLCDQKGECPLLSSVCG